MAKETRETGLSRSGLPEAVAVMLAGLTVLAALARHEPGRAPCSTPVPAGLERRTAPADRPVDMDAMLRDMRLHD